MIVKKGSATYNKLVAKNPWLASKPLVASSSSSSKSSTKLDKDAKSLLNKQLDAAALGLSDARSQYDSGRVNRLAALFNGSLDELMAMDGRSRQRIRRDSVADVQMGRSTAGLGDLNALLASGVARNEREAIGMLDEASRREQDAMRLQGALAADQATQGLFDSDMALRLAQLDMLAKKAGSLPTSSTSSSRSESFSPKNLSASFGNVSSTGPTGVARLGNRVQDPVTGFTRIVGGANG